MEILLGKQAADLKLDDILAIVERLQKIGLALGGGIAIIFILIGAFYYFTAFGSEEKAQKGKTVIMWAIVGIIVIALSEIVILTLKNLL